MDDFEMRSRLPSLVSSFFLAMPYFLSLILATAVAFIGWKRSQKAAMAVLAGVALMLLAWIGDMFLSRLVGYVATTGDSYRLLSGVVHFARNVAEGAAFVFVCSAGFIDRHLPNPLDKPR